MRQKVEFDSAGVRLAGPPPDAVREVHDKAFAHRVSQQERLVPAALRGLIAVLDASELERADEAVERIQGQLNAWPGWTRGAFTLKPRQGSSGRGRSCGAQRLFGLPGSAREGRANFVVEAHLQVGV